MKHSIGSISILVLVFAVTFSIAIGGLVLVAMVQRSSSQRVEIRERALAIAEAGAQYYRWHLSHDPYDFTNGTGSSGPYTKVISDPYGNTDGTVSLSIIPPASGSSIVTIESTGWLTDFPNTKRTIRARYGIPSLSKFSFLHNANVWFGSGLTVQGKVMSNGGIRMDGTNLSTIQSAKNTYTCGSETGCSPNATRNGVWGGGGPSALWQFPVPAVDFNALSVDFANLRSAAQSSGLYLGASGGLGYRIVFNSNGTFTVAKVTAATNRKGWSVENNCENLNQDITATTSVGTYAVNAKPVVFAEDHLWVSGTVNGKITVVAARFPIDTNSMNIWIPANLVYLAKDTNHNIGLFAQNNIYYGYNVPTNFEIDAALLAQKGRIIRHHYNLGGCSSFASAIRNSLTIYGSVISNQKSYWNFGSPITSGFTTRTITYDTALYFTPPPYFPTQGEYEFISWEEK